MYSAQYLIFHSSIQICLHSEATDFVSRPHSTASGSFTFSSENRTAERVTKPPWLYFYYKK